MGKIKLGVLVGGTSVEREISKKTCENLLKNLRDEKYDITIYHLPKNGDTGWARDIINNPPDIVMSALHGGNGENGSIQGFLHTIGVPYVGSKVLSSALCMDKYLAKTVMRAGKIQVADDVLLKRGENLAIYEQEIRQLGVPIIVKPNRGGSSIGISVVDDVKKLEAAVNIIREKYDDDVLIEKYIEGDEINCSVIQTTEKTSVMSVLDIKKSGRVFDYRGKYEIKGTLASVSAMPAFMQDMIKHIAIKTFNVLKCKGYACVDMIIRDENIFVIEVNTLPGLTSQSLIPQGLESHGISFADFLDKLIDYELSDK
jgi:D-alanine-D-alanine ligase